MTQTGPQRTNWTLVAGVWVLIAGLLAARTIMQFGAVPLLGDSDDAMRVVTATDLLNGQGWQDIVQHRDNAPFGAELHWSRLIDAPLAGLIALARPLAGSMAADIAAIVWPLLLMLPLMALCAVIVRRLVPDAGDVAAVVLPVISLVVLIEFLPGRVDHHGVQILLILTTLLALLAWRDRWTGGLIAGLALSTSLAIGLETLPFLAVAIGAIVVLWVLDPQRYRAAVFALGLTLALGTLAHFLIAVPPARYAVAACDATSITYVVAMGLGGIALAGTATLASAMPNRISRFAVMGVAGAFVLTVCAWFFPECLAGPYAVVDPRVDAILFAGIAEVQPLWRRIIEDPATGFAFGFPALAAVAIVVARLFTERGERRTDWAIEACFVVAAVLLMLVQIRGARFAGVFAVPAGAYLITAARRAYLWQPTAARAAALVASWLLFAGVAQFAAIGWLFPRTAAAAPSEFAGVACFRAADYAPLAALPAANVMAPVRIGSHILRYTLHSVVSAGFHRNNAGTLDVLDFFAGDEANAGAIVAARDIGYVVDCGGANEAALAGSGWLTRLPSVGTIQIYGVSRAD